MGCKDAALVVVLFAAPGCVTAPVPHGSPVAPPSAPADPTPAGWTRPPQRVIPWIHYRLAPPEEHDYEYDPERGEYRFPQEKRNGRPDVFVPERVPEPRCAEEYEPSS
jgi:hypothetical protein